MSTEEQDAIIGKLVRERRDLNQQLTLIEAELRSLSDELRAFHIPIDNRSRSRDPGQPRLKIAEQILKYADFSKLNILFDKQDALVQRLSDVEGSLSKLGL